MNAAEQISSARERWRLRCHRWLTVITFATCLCSVPAAAGELRFTTDVVPVLTKLGCNSGGCHGKATGQNGFRLSLLGFEPTADFQAIVHEARGRRISAAAPDESLLLLKATNQMAHGGGRRTDRTSKAYDVLRRWISEGVRPPSPDDPVVTRLEVVPGDAVLTKHKSQPLQVIAHLSDATSRVVTQQALFESNEPEIAAVDSSGQVMTHDRPGLFSVMVRYGGQVATFHAAVPLELTEADQTAVNLRFTELEAKLTEPVDRLLLAQWQRLGVLPSPPVDDVGFIRRVSLDICGTLPTRDEAQEYADSKDPAKRAKLIDRLLERREYAVYFGLKWADVLQNRGSGYSTGRQRPGTALFSGWIRDALASNKPYDQFVSEIITASGSQLENPPTVWYRQVRTLPNYVESVAQAFLGVRVQCAQCHQHPFDRWSQADYYGLAAVFSRVGRKGGFADAEVPTEEVIYLKDQENVHHPRTGEVIPPKALGGPLLSEMEHADPRFELAKWMTAADNPFFTRTIVNRMWAHFHGRGLIHPIDDARSTNPPTNPELLDYLAEDFVASGFDLKHLVRVICNAHSYRLVAAPNRWNSADSQTFARFYPRRLSAEVLLDAISQVLAVPTDFPGGPGSFPAGTRAIELPDENVADSFLDAFGRPARTSACECERIDAPSLGQALTLINSAEIQRKLSADGDYAGELASGTAAAELSCADIFWRFFARPPRVDELSAAVEFVESAEDTGEAYRSLLWAMLATNEFLFNH